MKEVIKAAMNTKAKAAKDVMGYIQGVSKALGEAGLPFDWTTPAGSRIRQAYFSCSEKRIWTVFGRATLMVDDAAQAINVRKQGLASAPNYVHSFDAAHLALTVVKANRDHGIRHFAMIHDSYGCHAADVQRLNDVLRETFVEMYQTDWLAQLEEDVRAYAPGVELPERPVDGGFDVSEVLEAQFFFS
jgi:DNA-directed RNA polymerase